MPKGDHVTGPYAHRDGYRLVLYRGGEKTYSEVYSSKEKALEVRDDTEREIAAAKAATFEEVIMMYEQHCRDKGNRPGRSRGNKDSTVTTEIDRVRAFFDRPAEEDPLPRLTPAGAERLYRTFCARPTQYDRPPSDAQQQNALKAARRFGAFCVKRKLWKDNPLMAVEMIGRPKAGEESKAQLRRAEAVLWRDTAAKLARGGDYQAEAALACLMLGVRASEIAARKVRDVEIVSAEEVTIWLPASTTKNGKPRRQLCPSPLGPLLLARVAGRFGLEPLYPTHDGMISRFSVRRAALRVCRAAGLHMVCPQGLRGSHSSLGHAAGLSPLILADGQGHSEAVARRHYATAEAQAAGVQGRVLSMLDGPGAPENVAQDVAQEEGGEGPQ